MPGNLKVAVSFDRSDPAEWGMREHGDSSDEWRWRGESHCAVPYWNQLLSCLVNTPAGLPAMGWNGCDDLELATIDSGFLTSDEGGDIITETGELTGVSNFADGCQLTHMAGDGIETPIKAHTLPGIERNIMFLDNLGRSTLIALLACVAALMLMSVRVNAQAYHLTFDDEFNNLTLSNQDMNGDGGPMHSGTYESWYRCPPSATRHLVTGEQQEFIDPSFYGLPQQGPASLGINPFSVHNGILTIEGNPAPATDYAYLENQKYTSGLLTTFSSFSQTYGYFECRARLPQGPGLWPAFWMLPTTLLPAGNLKWQYEIDIFECFGNATKAGGGSNQVHWALHHGNQGAGDWATVPGNIYTGYHTYGVDWEPYPGNCTFYFDGKVIGKAPTASDMNQPMFLLVCLALGGTWMGPPDPASGEFPAKMDIDYMRAYSNDPNVPAVAPQPGYKPSRAIPIPLVDSGRK